MKRIFTLFVLLFVFIGFASLQASSITSQRSYIEFDNKEALTHLNDGRNTLGKLKLSSENIGLLERIAFKEESSFEWAINDALLSDDWKKYPIIKEENTFSPSIHLPQQHFNLWQIAIGTERLQNVDVQNNGTSPLIITELQFPFEGVTALNDFPIEIAAGSSASLQLSFKPEIKGEQSGQVRIISNAAIGNGIFYLSATYHAINELVLNAGSTITNRVSALKIRLRNTERLATLQFDIDLPDKLFYIENSAKLLSINTDHQVQVTQENRRLRVIITSPTNQELPLLNQDLVQVDIQVNAGPSSPWINLSGAIGSSLQENIIFSRVMGGIIMITAPVIKGQQAVDFGTMILGEEKDIILNIENTGGAMLNLIGVSTELPGLTTLDILPRSIFPSGNFPLSLKYKPQAIGDHAGYILLNNNSYNLPEFPINFSAKVIAPNYLKLSQVQGVTEEVTFVPIHSDFFSEITSLQFDLQLHPSIILQEESIILSEAIHQTHQLTLLKMDGDVWRFLINPTDNQTLPKGEQVLMELPTSIKADGVYELSFDNIIASPISGPSIDIIPQNGEVTIGKGNPSVLSVINKEGYKSDVTHTEVFYEFNQEVADIQFDLTISPENGLDLGQVELDGSIQLTHQLSTSFLGNGRHRFLVQSNENKVIPTGKGVLMKLPIEITEIGNYEISISEKIVTSLTGDEIEMIDMAGQIIIHKDLEPTISIEANTPTFDHEGQSIRYIITVSNETVEELQNLEIKDKLTGIDLIRNLNSGEKSMLTGEYRVTQEDLIRGYISNAAVAVYNGLTFESEEIRVEAIIDINLTLRKKANKEHYSSIEEAIIYELLVMNNGNLPMENIRVIDSLTGFDQTIKKIGPGGEMVMFNFFHLVTEADVERGYVSGTAYALWEDQEFKSEEIRVTYLAEEDNHPIIAGPTELTLEGVYVQQKKSFSIKVENVGFQDLTLDAIKSNLPGIHSLQPFPIEIKPGESIELFFEITPTASGELTGEIQIKNNSKNDFEFSVRVGANVLEENNLVVTSHEGTLEEIGTVDLMYEFKEEVSSLQFDLFISPAEGLLLGKAALDKTISQTHQLTATSLGNGHYRFQIQSSEKKVIPIGKGVLMNLPLEKLEIGSYEISISNESVSSSSGSELGVEVGAGQIIIQANPGPTISIESNTPTFDHEGQKISYTITLANETAVALQNIRILDVLTGLDLNLNLNPGQQEVLSREYLVKQEDLLRGYISNSAAAVYNGRKYESNEIRIEAVVDVNLTVSKKALTESYVKAGEEIPYELVVLNSGNILLENIRLIDSLSSFEQIIEKLGPGEEIVFNYSYAVTEADVERGNVVSTAYAIWEDMEFKSQEIRVVYLAQEESYPIISGPAELVLEDVFVQHKKEFFLVVENSGNEDLILEGIKSNLAGLKSLQSFPLTLKAGATLELLFEIIAQTPGLLIGEIQIKNNSQNNPEFSVRIETNVLEENHITVSSLEGKVNEISSVFIEYDFTTDVSALQFDLNIEPNIALDLTTIQLSQTIKNTHQVSASKLSDGKYRLLVFSLQNALISSGKGNLMEIPMKPMEPGSYNLQLANITLSSAAGMDLPFDKTDGLLTVTGEMVTHPVELEVGVLADLQSFSVVGEQVVFNFSIKNLGKDIVRQIKAVDQLLQDLTEINELEPGAIFEWTKTYTVTQNDIDKAGILNRVKTTVGEKEFWSNELSINYVEQKSPMLLAEKDIYFPTKFINQKYQISIPVKNGGTSPLSIEDIVVEFPYLLMQESLPLTIEPGVSYDISFSYEPKETGSFTDTVRLMSNSSEHAEWKLALHSKVVEANKLSAGSSGDNARSAAVDVNYNFSTEVATLNFDLSISPNPTIDLDKVVLAEHLSPHHNLSVSRVGEGKFRFSIYSPQNRLIPEGEGLLLTIPLDSKVTATYKVTFDHVLISSAQNGEMPVETSSETIEVQDPIMSLDIHPEYRNHVFLHQNYPNPFVRETTIKISLPKEMSVKLSVYNMDGREVAILMDGYLKGGEHELLFDGEFLAKGIYFYQLQVDNMVFHKKMIKN